MALIKYDPFAGLSSMHSQLDDLFNNVFWGTSQATSLPATDVYTEDDKTLVAELHAPGFTRDDIEVQVRDGILEIKGEKHEKQEDTPGKKRNYVVRESHASFYRSVALPRAADGDKVEAHFADGVLQVRVPLQQLPAPKKVTIGAGARATKNEKK